MSNVDRRRSYRPGGWFGIFGDHASVLLPPSEKPRVTALWELVDDGAGFDEVLDGLLASGLRDLPGFVLVSEAAGVTKVVLRGAAVAAFVVDGDMVELAGSTDTTWVERSFVGASQMFVQVEATDEEEGEDLLIENGLVRLGRVDQPPFKLEDTETVADDEAAAVAEEPLAEGESRVEDLGVAVPVVVAEPEAEEAEEPVAEEPVAEEPEVEEPAAEEPVAEEPEVGEPEVGEEPEVEEEPAAEEAEVEEPAAEEAVEPVAEEAEAEPQAEEPAAEEPQAEEPAAEEQPSEEPPAEPEAEQEQAEQEQAEREPAEEEPAVEVPEALDDESSPEEQEAPDERPADDTVVDVPAIGAELPPPPPPPAWGHPEPAADPAAERPAWQTSGDSFATPAPAYPPPEAPRAPEAVPPADHDGLTDGGWQPDSFSRPQSGITSSAEASPTGPVVAKLLFSSGEVVEVDRPILVGRSPEVRRFASHDRPRLVPVPSPHQEISSTHLEVRPGVGADHGAAVVTDLGSTNGTVLVQPGLPPEDLQPGIAVPLVPGAIIDLGDGLTVQVTQP